MPATQLTSEQLTSVLNGLYDYEATANQAAQPQPIDDPRVVATYKDAEGRIRYLIVCDLPLANSLGAGLTMIPPGGAEDATAEGLVPPNIGDNLHEVLNVCSVVFAEAEHQRVVLDQIFPPSNEMPAELAEKTASAETMLQVQYELDRYQPGRMSLLKITA